MRLRRVRGERRGRSEAADERGGRPPRDERAQARQPAPKAADEFPRQPINVAQHFDDARHAPGRIAVAQRAP